MAVWKSKKTVFLRGTRINRWILAGKKCRKRGLWCGVQLQISSKIVPGDTEDRVIICD